MSAGNEYPFAGDLTDTRISGMLHSTLERLARRVAENNVHIYNLARGEGEGDFKAGPSDSFSSPGLSSWSQDPNNDVSSSSQLARYNWGTNWCCGAGYWTYEATAEPATKGIGFGRYRRLSPSPLAQVSREGDGTVSCQNRSTQLHNSIDAAFGSASSGNIAVGAKIKGTIAFNLPSNFKGFKPHGVEFDFRVKGTGMGTGGTNYLQLSLTAYKPHCATALDPVATDTTKYYENGSPTGVEPIAGTADSVQHDTVRLTAASLGPYWAPEDSVRVDVELSHSTSSAIDTLNIYIGSLKVNYRT